MFWMLKPSIKGDDNDQCWLVAAKKVHCCWWCLGWLVGGLGWWVKDIFHYHAENRSISLHRQTHHSLTFSLGTYHHHLSSTSSPWSWPSQRGTKEHAFELESTFTLSLHRTSCDYDSTTRKHSIGLNLPLNLHEGQREGHKQTHSHTTNIQHCINPDATINDQLNHKFTTTCDNTRTRGKV